LCSDRVARPPFLGTHLHPESGVASEEHAVALASDHGEHAGRGLGGIGDELEVRAMSRPCDGGAGLEELSFEVVLGVTEADRSAASTPVNLQGHGGRHTGAALEGVVVRPEVSDDEVAEADGRDTLVEIDLHAVRRDQNRPEEPAGRDARIVRVNLVGRGHLPLEDVQSDESEGSMMALVVDPDVLARHESGVRLEHEWDAAVGSSLAGTPDPRVADESLEVGDRRRL